MGASEAKVKRKAEASRPHCHTLARGSKWRSRLEPFASGAFQTGEGKDEDRASVVRCQLSVGESAPHLLSAPDKSREQAGCPGRPWADATRTFNKEFRFQRAVTRQMSKVGSRRRVLRRRNFRSITDYLYSMFEIVPAVFLKSKPWTSAFRQR